MKRPQETKAASRQGGTWAGLTYGFIGLFALAVCLGAAYASWHERVALINTQLERTQSTALVMEEEITLTLKLFENTMRALAEGTELAPASMSQATMDGLLNRLVRNQPMLRSLSVLNADGVVYSSSNPANRGVRLPLQDFLPTGLADNNPGLRIGSAWTGRDLHNAAPLPVGDPVPIDLPYFVPSFMQLSAESDRFFVVAVLNPDHFLNRFDRQTTNSSLITFQWVRLDGRVLAHSGEVSQPSLFGPPSLLSQISLQEIGHAQGQSITAFRTSGLYPFFVTVDISQTAALASWRENAIAWATGVTLALSLVLWLTLLLLRKLRQEEEQLTAERVRLQAVYNVLPVGVSITDPEGHIIDCNPASERLLGITKAEHLARDYDSKDWAISREDGTPMPSEEFASVRALKEQTPVYDSVMRLSQPAGEVWLSVSALPVPHPQFGVVIAYSDITEQKKQAQALLAAKQQAEAASQYKSQFLANMSHEIRTPMNAILGMLKLLHHTPLQTRQLDYVDKTESAARSLLGLINDILDFSKVEAGKLTLDPQPFDLQQMVSDLAIIFSANLQNKALELLLDVAPDVPNRLIGDVMRLQQILINLGGNAIKFTPAGQVVLSISVLEQRASSMRLGFEVRDTGIGIAPENQQKIFNGFTQAEASTTRRFGGTGLGLAISRRLVELMGGELTLKSELGEGTVFHFSLPFYVPPVKHTEPANPGCKVLLIEAHDGARALTDRMLQQLQHTVYSTASPEVAREWLAQHRNRGQAFDWVMMGGLPNNETPWSLVSETPERVALCTTAAQRESAMQQPSALQAMVDGYLLKPLTLEPLAKLIQKAPTRTLGAAGGASIAATQNLLGLRLLVVEDNVINQQVAQELLMAQGAYVDLADNGEQGVQAVANAVATQQPYDAVLMDMQMPVMDGLTATRAIRGQLAITALPIIAMTANAMPSDRESCLAAGMNDHIGKPFELDHLVTKLLQWTRPDQPVNFQALLNKPAVESSAEQPSAGASPGEEALLYNPTAALARLGGSQTLFQRMVRHFRRDLPEIMQKCKQASHEGQLSDLSVVLHTLKGTAATLGAEALAAACSKAERVARSGKQPDVSAVQTVAEATLSALQADADMPQTAPVPLAFAPIETSPALSADQLSRIAELHELLLANDMSVFERLESLQDLPNNLVASPSWRNMLRSVDALDFATASELCAEWVQNTPKH